MAIITYSSFVDDDADALEVWPPSSKLSHHLSSKGREQLPSVSEITAEKALRSQRHGILQRVDSGVAIPMSQRALVLHSLRQPYQLTDGYSVPATQASNEMIVKIHSIGLNPVDWKSV